MKELLGNNPHQSQCNGTSGEEEENVIGWANKGLLVQAVLY